MQHLLSQEVRPMLSKQAAHRKDLSGKPATFTHQHFREVASIIRKLGTERATWISEHFATELSVTNPRFDRHRFLMACQPVHE